MIHLGHAPLQSSGTSAVEKRLPGKGTYGTATLLCAPYPSVELKIKGLVRPGPIDLLLV